MSGNDSYVDLEARVHNLEQALICLMIAMREEQSPGLQARMDAVMQPFHDASSARGGCQLPICINGSGEVEIFK